MAKVTHYTVVASFVTTIDGNEVEYIAGDVVGADDPAIKKAPVHFEPLIVRAPDEHRRTVEQATAAPGEKRRLSLHRRKPKAKAEPKPEPTPEPEPEPEGEPQGKAITTASFKGH